jgi:hypothetical protein
MPREHRVQQFFGCGDVFIGSTDHRVVHDIDFYMRIFWQSYTAPDLRHDVG